MVRQSGAISVPGLEDLVDTANALTHLPPVRGLNVGVTGGSGGQSVNIADVLAEVGMRLPRLTEASYDKLREFYSIIGGGFNNPVDTGNQNRFQMARIVDILAEDPNIDNLVLLSLARMMDRNGRLDNLVEMMGNLRRSTDKPLISIISYHSLDELPVVKEAVSKFQENGIPTFMSLERGALALKNAFEYYRMREFLSSE
jgi:acyl-CoA synthetase (NDP forming)